MDIITSSTFLPGRSFLREGLGAFFKNSSRVDETQKKDVKDIYAASEIHISTVIFYLFVAGVIIAGWCYRSEEYIVPDSGLGYGLGIMGGTMMLFLFLYPLRKRVNYMRNWGRIKDWFRIHTIMGIIGPVIILFHTNFSVGSINSAVVLTMMLLVMGSGFVGQFIYARIHYGLYGRKLSLEELQKDFKGSWSSLTTIFKYAPKLQKRMLNFQTIIMAPPRGVCHSITRVLFAEFWKRWTYLLLVFGLNRALKVASLRLGWSVLKRKRMATIARRQISNHLTMTLRTAEFSFYERILSLWHMFHMPLFVMLILTGIIHVVAVHLY